MTGWNEKICRWCVYYLDYSLYTGVCCRFPPRFIEPEKDPAEDVFYHPLVDSECICGEFIHTITGERYHDLRTTKTNGYAGAQDPAS